MHRMATINRFAVAAIMRARGVKVSTLASEIGLDRTTLSTALNTGKRTIPLDRLIALSQSLSVDPRALLGPDDANRALAEVAA